MLCQRGGLNALSPLAAVCWSHGALQNIKFQYQMTKISLEFGISVIVICLIFEICDLEFLFVPNSKTARKLYRQSH